MDESQPQGCSPRLLAILFWLLLIMTGLATVGGRVVGGWGGMLIALFGGFVLTGTFTGLFGGSCVLTWLMICLISGIFQAVFWGWSHHGWMGAAVGVPAGVVLGWAGAVGAIFLVFALAFLFDRSAFTTPTEAVNDGESEAESRPESE